mgnify:FL=1
MGEHMNAMPTTPGSPSDEVQVAQAVAPIPRRSALVRALLGWLAVGVGLGLAIGIPRGIGQQLALADGAVVAIQSIIMAGFVLAAIVALRHRLDRRSLAGLGWSWRAGRAGLVGAGVAVLTGIVAWLPAVMLGWIEIESIAVGTFLSFLVVNTLVIVAYEALPEEMALRGYVWTNLRDGWGLVFATVVTTAIFPFTAIVASSVAWLATSAFGGAPQAPRLFPEGSDPVLYIVQLVAFGLVLVAARRLPIRGAVLVAAAFHAAHLTVNRLLLGGSGWLDSGWSVRFVEEDAIALVLVNLVLAGLMFIVIRRLRQARTPA